MTSTDTPAAPDAGAPAAGTRKRVRWVRGTALTLGAALTLGVVTGGALGVDYLHERAGVNQLVDTGSYAYSTYTSGDTAEAFLMGTGVLEDPLFHTHEFATWRKEVEKVYLREATTRQQEAIQAVAEATHWPSNRAMVEDFLFDFTDGERRVADQFLRSDIATAVKKGCPALAERDRDPGMADLASPFTDPVTGKRHLGEDPPPMPSPDTPGTATPPAAEPERTYVPLLPGLLLGQGPGAEARMRAVEEPYLAKITAVAQRRCADLT